MSPLEHPHQGSVGTVVAQRDVEVLDTPSLDALVEAVHREHQLVAQAGAAMIEHAIRAGDALLEAKRQVTQGDWEGFLKREFPDKHPKTLRLYMRVARNQEVVRVQQPATLTAANRFLAGQALRPTNPEMRDEARRLVQQEGCSQREAARRLGVSSTTVQAWLNPKVAERRRQRLRQESRAARRALHRQQRDAAARKAGGSVADAYGLLRKAAQALEDAMRTEDDRDVKQHISLAMERLYRCEDEVVKASRRASALGGTL